MTSQLAGAAAWMLDAAVKSTVILLAAAGVVRLMSRASAASRHVVWTAALVATVLLPIASLLVPAVPVRGVPTAVAAIMSPPAAGHGAESVPSSPSSAMSTMTSRAIDAAPSGADDAAWRPALVLIWLAGVVGLLARRAAGTFGVWRLSRRARRLDDADLWRSVQNVARRLGVRRPVTVLVAEADWVPVTWGVVYPTILLPSSAARWSRGRLEAVLVHELAHVARLDALSHVAAGLATTVWWFNPLAWVAARHALLERERACDDRVIDLGARPSTYADDLLTLVQSLGAPAIPAFSALAMARRSQFEGRLLAILDAGIDRRPRSRASLGVAALIVVAIAPVAALRPAAPPLSLDRLSIATEDAQMTTELDNLQGTWRVTTLETDGNAMPGSMLGGAEIVVAGDRFTTRGMGASYAGTIALDLTSVPRRLDLNYTDGPHQGTASLAIYELDGDRWRICLSMAGGSRPAAFRTSPGSGHALETLVRATAASADPTPAVHQQAPATGELARLGGEWTVMFIETGGQKLPDAFVKGATRVMRGTEVTVTVAGQVMVHATMEVEPSKTPKTFEYTILDGPDKGKAMPGIYELDGDTLRTNFTQPGRPRPTGFTTRAGDECTSSAWTRVKK